MNNTRALIEQCRDALAEEISAWDIDPPLFHVKEAHDACVAWLAAPAAPTPHPDTELLDWLDREASVGNGLHLACLSGGLRSAISARIARDKAARKVETNA